jgi:SAM-dependent methyltransferase
MSKTRNKTESTDSEYVEYGREYLDWKKWGADFGNLRKTEKAYFSAELARTGRRFTDRSRVLEIGSGNGNFLSFATRENWEVCGTEANESLVELAKQNGYSVLHTKDLSNFQDSTFDLVVAFDVLEHIPQNLIPDLITEINRILKHDGYFIARYPNGDSPFGLPHQNGDVTHVTTIGSAKMRYFVASTNMQLVFLGGEAQPIVGSSARYMLHRLVMNPLKAIINFLVVNIFFPRGEIAFCSLNLTVILRSIKI